MAMPQVQPCTQTCIRLIQFINPEAKEPPSDTDTLTQPGDGAKWTLVLLFSLSPFLFMSYFALAYS